MRSSALLGSGENRLGWLWLLAIGLAAATSATSCRVESPHVQCVRAFEQENYEHAIAHCSKSYEESRAQDDLLRLAAAQMKKADYAGVVNSYRKVPLAVISEDGEALIDYGFSLMAQHDQKEALSKVELAQRAFQRKADQNGVVKALVVRSQIYWSRGELAEALAQSEDAFVILERSQIAARPVRNAHLAKIDALRRMGRFDAARVVLDKALKLDMTECQMQWVQLREAMWHEEQHAAPLAFSILEKIEKSMGGCEDSHLEMQVYSNLAWLYYDEFDYESSISNLNKVMDLSEEYDFDDRLLRALIAGQKGEWAAAKRFLDQAAEIKPNDEDWQWELNRAFAELSEESGDLVAAERYYEKAILDVMFLRRELRRSAPYYVASHRAPFEGLIGLLAKQGRWAEVVEVVQLMDSSDMLSPGIASPSQDRMKLDEDEQANRKNFVLIRNPREASAIIDARSNENDLAIVIAVSKREFGDEKELAYRILIRDGAVTGEEVGWAKDVRTWAANLDSGKWTHEEAKQLSKVFVPPGSSTVPLTILGVGELGKVRLGALEDENGSLTSSRRPLMRTFSLREELPSPSFGDARVVIAANPTGNVPRVETDAAEAAQALGLNGKASVVKRYWAGAGVAATRDRLAEAKSADVLYIAAHSGEKNDSRTIALDDGPVTVEQLQAMELAPRFAVLPICESARATDEEGRNSVAATLVKQGSERVLATNYKVDDGTTQVFMGALVKQPDWLSAPEVALARVQQEAARTGQLNGVKISQDLWSSFVVIVRAPYVPPTKTASLPQTQP